MNFDAMNFKAWLQRQAPDFVETWQRFPLAIAFTAAMTAITLFAINDVEWLRQEVWARAAAGFGAGSIFAVAGVYFADSRPEARRWGLALKYLVPLLAIALFEVTDIAWFVPFALPVIAVLWLSVSPFTRLESGAAREDQQRRFWLINHQALASAIIAGGAFGIIALGFLIIERSLSMLFGLEVGAILYKWLLPFTGLFLTPVYWLSTLPKLSELEAGDTERPDFVGKAVGFLGQFVLVPMLFIYSLILLAYTAQIVFTQQLPEGMIGWMVLGFVIVGAATWLVLFPPFMREKPLVRLFRRLWFWLTLVPLALFFFAVWVRIDAYGLTAERILLVAGGAWAVVLAVAFLSRRGDIRIIPALAGAILLLVSIGPWNYAQLPITSQLARLDALMMNAGADQSASPPRVDWSAAEITEARNIVDFLTTPEGKRGVRELMGRYGVTWSATEDGGYAVLAALGVTEASAGELQRYVSAYRDPLTQPVDVSATPFLIRPLSLYTNVVAEANPLRFEGSNGKVFVATIADSPGDRIEIPVADWLAAQDGSMVVVGPTLDFVVAGVQYRLAVQSVTFDRGENNAGPRVFSSIEALLFSAVRPTP